MTPPPEVLEIPLPAVTLSALAWGPADGPLVVALHGFPDTAWTWRHLGPHLAERGHRVVAPNTRGYAPSGIAHDGSYHVSALMADAVGVHEALGGDDRAVLVGHDWGAITANGLGANELSPYRRIVSIAVPPFPVLAGRVSPRMIARQARLSWYTLFNQLPVLPERNFERLVRHLWQVWSPGYDAAEDLERVLASLADPTHRSAAIGYYRAAVRQWRVPDGYRPFLDTWTDMPTVPALYLHGADDGCLQAAYAERGRDLLPAGSETVIVPDTGHFLHLEQPAAVNDLLSRFIEG
ncbi:alpha/beta hydrolase [Nocardioides sp.]|uniref:alpha/beta fold hydrolase n=1 Tax=Nocardioides sp. TaxID=35761 RepID=UPI0031FEFE57